MKKLIVLFVVLFLFSCGYSSIDCYESVSNKYKDSIVYQIPGEEYRYIVKTKSGEVRYIETMNITNTNITQDFKVFQLHQKGE